MKAAVTENAAPKSKNGNTAHRKFSAQVVDGVERAASRAMLHAVGFTRSDFKKPQIGIASTWSQVTPCNIHIDKLARESAAGVDTVSSTNSYAGSRIALVSMRSMATP